MNQMLLNEFGFKQDYYIFDMKKNRKRISTREQKLQMEVLDFPLKEYICPISKRIWENIRVHQGKCKYQYCKGEWDFKGE